MHDLKNNLITQKGFRVCGCLQTPDHSGFQQSIIAESRQLTVHLLRGLLHAEQLTSQQSLSYRRCIEETIPHDSILQIALKSRLMMKRLCDA